MSATCIPLTFRTECKSVSGTWEWAFGQDRMSGSDGGGECTFSPPQPGKAEDTVTDQLQ